MAPSSASAVPYANATVQPNRNTQDLVELVTKSRTVLSSFAKAKTAKLGTMNTLSPPMA